MKKSFRTPIIVFIYKNGKKIFADQFRNGPIILGRQPGCDVIIEEDYISRTHCQIDEDNQGIRVVDSGSKNPFLRRGVFEPLSQHANQIILELKELRLEVYRHQPGFQEEDNKDTVVRRLE